MIVLRFGNSRLQTYNVLASGTCLAGIDTEDDFWLVRNGKGSFAADLNGAGVCNQQQNKLRFTNFFSRVNRLPSTVVISPVLHPLVESLCAATVEANPTRVDVLPLFYLLPINAREAVWSALASLPFIASGISIEPRGFLDEMLLILFAAGTRAVEAHLEPPFDLYVIFQISQISVACRLSGRQSRESFTIQPAEIFPIHHLHLSGLDAVHSVAIFTIEDQLGSTQDIKPMLSCLHSASSVRDLGSATWQEVLSMFLGKGIANTDAVLEFNLNRYMGLWDGNSFWHVMTSAFDKFPSSCSTILELGPWQRERRVTFFRGYFPTPHYCYSFNPVLLPSGDHGAAYLVSIVADDLETARAEFWSVKKGHRNGRLAVSTDLISPPSLFAERNLT